MKTERTLCPICSTIQNAEQVSRGLWKFSKHACKDKNTRQISVKKDVKLDIPELRWTK